MKNTDNVIEKIVFYYDTDCGGVVYYANYLKYFEEGRTGYLRGRGVSIDELHNKGIFFVVRKADIDYHRPARYGDELTVASNIIKVGRASMQFEQEITRDKEMLVKAVITLVMINKDFKPQALPESILKAL